jgi:hypothetical protein
MHLPHPHSYRKKDFQKIQWTGAISGWVASLPLLILAEDTSSTAVSVLFFTGLCCLYLTCLVRTGGGYVDFRRRLHELLKLSLPMLVLVPLFHYWGGDHRLFGDFAPGVAVMTFAISGSLVNINTRDKKIEEA